MDYSSAFAISAVGMDIERTRVEVATLNLANASTVQAPGQAGYEPLRVVAIARGATAGAAGAASAFAALVEAGEGDPLAPPRASAPLQALPAVSVVPSGAAPRLVHDPAHPLADASGQVAHPGVDVAAETVQLMSATRAYEANVAAMNTSRTLALRALDIGGPNA